LLGDDPVTGERSCRRGQAREQLVGPVVVVRQKKGEQRERTDARRHQDDGAPGRRFFWLVGNDGSWTARHSAENWRLLDGSARSFAMRGWAKTLARKPVSVMIRAPRAKVAELADAQDSGSCDREVVGVQVPPF